jgi:small subunit ribosomal protein S7
MPRKTTKSLVRIINPDRKYGSVMLQKVINRSMVDGKKSSAEKAVYQAVEGAAEKLKLKNPIEAFDGAIKNIAPSFEVKGRRVGGANYQIPFPLADGQRKNHLTIMWLVQAARAKSGMPYFKRLETELVDAFNNTGTAVKKKEDTHKMAEANKAFAHYVR